jgi:hypothetical protein
VLTLSIPVVGKAEPRRFTVVTGDRQVVTGDPELAAAA